MSDNKMNAKKVLSFLLCTPAFTRRNITSLLLVGGFFFVYVLAGGKIDTELPNAKNANSFGGAGLGISGQDSSSNQDAGVQREGAPRQILGEVTPRERRARESASHMKGRIFTDEDAEIAAQESHDRSGLIQGRYRSPESVLEQRAIEKSRKRAPDPLEAIEERLRQSR
jgi:hypothetical protein